MNWSKGNEFPPTRTVGFTTNPPKAIAPGDRIKNHSQHHLNRIKLERFERGICFKTSKGVVLIHFFVPHYSKE